MNFKKIISIGLATVMTLQTVAFANEATFSLFPVKNNVRNEEMSVIPVKDKNYRPEKNVENEKIEDRFKTPIGTQRKRINPKTDKYDVAKPADDEIRVIATFKESDAKNQVEKTNENFDINKKYYIGNKHTVMNVDENDLNSVLEDQDSYVIENDHLVFMTSNEKIAYEIDFSMQPLAGNNYPDSFEKIDINSYHEDGIYGTGVKIAVLDTGMDTQNSELNIAGGATFVEESDSFEDDNGHGTAMAGIIGALMDDRGLTGIAPSAELYSVKVLDSNGIGRTSGVISGIYWAIENDIDIIYFGFSTEEYSYALETVIKEARENNILMIAPAGNNSSNKSEYPAMYNDVVSVGSLDNNGSISEFSNYGSSIDLFAPGNEIESVLYFNNRPTPVSGTSVSAAFVTGYAALILEKYRGVSNFDIFDEMTLEKNNTNDFSVFYFDQTDTSVLNEGAASINVPNISTSVSDIVHNHNHEIAMISTTATVADASEGGESSPIIINPTYEGSTSNATMKNARDKVYFCVEVPWLPPHNTSVTQAIMLVLDYSTDADSDLRICSYDVSTKQHIDITGRDYIIFSGKYFDFYVEEDNTRESYSNLNFELSCYLLDVETASVSKYGDFGVYAPTGNFNYSFTDFNSIVAGESFPIQRQYNSKDENDTHLGRGWRLNFESRAQYTTLDYVLSTPDGSDNIQHTEELSSAITVVIPDGTILNFAKQSVYGEYSGFVYDEDSGMSYYDEGYGYVTEFVPQNTRAHMYMFKDAFSSPIEITMPDDTTYYYAPLERASAGYSELRGIPHGYLYKIEDKYGNVTDITYGSNDKIWKIVKNGKTYTFEYNSAKLLARIIDSTGRSVNYEYDSAGNLIKSIDANGVTYNYGYNEDGYLISIKNSNDVSLAELTYIDNTEDSRYMNVDTYTDGFGRIQKYTYDLSNNITIIEDLLSDGSVYKETRTYYDEDKDVLEYTDELGRVSKTKYYSFSYAPELSYGADYIFVPDTNNRNFPYPFVYKNGEIEEYISSTGIKTNYEFDELYGIPVSKTVTMPDGEEMEYEEYTYYDDYYITSIKRKVSENSENHLYKLYTNDYYDYRETTYGEGYIRLGSTSEYLPLLSAAETIPLVSDNSQMFSTVSYEYDEEHDVKGLIVKESVSNDDKHWIYEYDDSGNLISIENPESTSNFSTKDVFEYGAFGKITKATSSDGVITTYEYDNNLQEIKKTTNGNEITRTIYNDLGLPVQIVSPNLYDTTKEIEDGTYSDDSAGVIYEYYGNGKLKSETDAMGSTTTYVYDRYANVIEKTVANGGKYIYTYDLLSNLVSVSFKSSDSSNSFLMEENAYTYSDGYTIHEQTKYNSDNNSSCFKYIYGHKNQLLEVWNVTDFDEEKIREIRYDMIGNPICEFSKMNDNEWIAVYYTYYNYDGGNNVTYNEKFTAINTIPELPNLSTLPTNNAYKYERTDYDKNGNIIATHISTVPVSSAPSVENNSNIITETNEYYADNLIKSTTDANGVKNEHEYDNDRNLSKVTVTESGKAPQIIAYTNSHNGKPETIKTYVDDANVTDSDNLLSDSLGTYTLTTNTYDKNGNLTKQDSSTGLTTEYTYDKNNLQISTTSYETGKENETSQSEIFEYDFRGNVIKQIKINGPIPEQFDEEDENINITSFVYNELGYLIYTIHPNDRITLTTRDKYGKLIAEVDAVDYDGAATAENATVTTYETDKSNISEMSRTEYTYDQFDRVVKVTKHTYDPETETTTSVVRQTNTYDMVGNLVTTTDANGNTFGYEYDAFGNVTKYIEPSKYAPAEDFDEEEGEIRPYTTFYEYDVLGRKIKEGNSDGDYYAYTYDKKGNILSSAIVEDGESQTISTYTYDDGGRILTQTDGNGHTTTLVYDDNNRLMKQYAHGDEDDETKTDYYSYDILGNLTEHTTRNGDTIEYEYDVFNRLVKTTSEDGIVTYTYDNNGNILTMTDSTGTTTYTYDSMGRILTKNHSETGTVSYEYDIYTGIPYGYVAEITTDPDGDVVEKWYDSEDKIVKVIDGTDVTWYTYYDDGRLESTTKPDGSVSTNTYDDEGNLLTLVTLDVAEDVLDSFTYVYDDNSIGYKNQISKTEIVAGENKGTTACEYDILGRLTKVTNPDGSYNEYTYDNAGNRLTKKTVEGDNTVVTSFTYDDENRLTQSVTGNATTYYGYDNNGNQISEWTRVANVSEATDGVKLGLQNETTDDLLTLYAYDAFDRLIKIEQGEDIIENTYTADGKKLSRTINGVLTYYVYDGNVVIEELDEDNDETSRNVYGRNLITRETDVNKIVYGFNGHGDVVYQANLDNIVLVVYDYDEFGNVVSEENVVNSVSTLAPSLAGTADSATETIWASTDSIDNPYRYAGYEYIEEVNLYDLNARYYNPEIARFLSADPYFNLGNRVIGLYEINVPDAWSIVQANALYTYCGNNSILFVDPFGLRGWFQPGGYDPYEADPSQTPPATVDTSIVEYEWFSKTTTNPITIIETDDSINIYAYVYISGEGVDEENFLAPPNAEGRLTMSYRDAIIEGIYEGWNGSYQGKDVVLHIVDLNDGNSYFTQPNQKYVNIKFEKNLAIPQVDGEFSLENPGTIYMYEGDMRKHVDHFRTTETMNCCQYKRDDFMLVAAHEFGHVLGIGDLYDDEFLEPKYTESLKTPSIMGDIWHHRCAAQEIDYTMMLRAYKENKFMTWYNNRDLLGLPLWE